MDIPAEQLRAWLHGLAWRDENRALVRLPERLRGSIDDHLWAMASMTSGVRLRFRTACDVIGLDVASISPATHGRLSPYVENGFDLYADGAYVSTIPGPASGGQFLGYFTVDGKEARDYEIHFPYHAAVELAGAWVEFKHGREEPVLEPADPFALPGPVVFYGSSITHGSDAQRAGLTYPALVSRKLGIDFVNLGFGGAGKGEPAVAEAIASIREVAAYVLDWGINLCAPGEVHLIHERYQVLLDTLALRKPGTPVLIVNVQHAGPRWDDVMARNLDTIRSEIARCHEREVALGHDNVKYVDAREIIGPGDADLTVDRVHPNQAGFHRYAAVLAPVIKEMLETGPSRLE